MSETTPTVDLGQLELNLHAADAIGCEAVRVQATDLRELLRRCRKLDEIEAGRGVWHIDETTLFGLIHSYTTVPGSGYRGYVLGFIKRLIREANSIPHSKGTMERWYACEEIRPLLLDGEEPTAVTVKRAVQRVLEARHCDQIQALGEKSVAMLREVATLADKLTAWAVTKEREQLRALASAFAPLVNGDVTPERVREAVEHYVEAVAVLYEGEVETWCSERAIRWVAANAARNAKPEERE